MYIQQFNYDVEVVVYRVAFVLTHADIISLGDSDSDFGLPKKPAAKKPAAKKPAAKKPAEKKPTAKKADSAATKRKQTAKPAKGLCVYL